MILSNIGIIIEMLGAIIIFFNEGTEDALFTDIKVKGIKRISQNTRNQIGLGMIVIGCFFQLLNNLLK